MPDNRRLDFPGVQKHSSNECSFICPSHSKRSVHRGQRAEASSRRGCCSWGDSYGSQSSDQESSCIWRVHHCSSEDHELPRLPPPTILQSVTGVSAETARDRG